MAQPAFLTFSIDAFHHQGNVCGAFFIHMKDAEGNIIKPYTAHVYASADPESDPGTVSIYTLAGIAMSMAQSIVHALAAVGHDIQIKDCLTAGELSVRIKQVMDFQRANGLPVPFPPPGAINRSIAR